MSGVSPENPQPVAKFAFDLGTFRYGYFFSCK
jgi:hypothetical protein